MLPIAAEYRASLALMLSLGFLMNLEYSILMPSVWEYVRNLGGDKVALGLTLAMFSLFRIIAFLPVGAWADARPLKEVLLGMTVISVLGNLMYGYAERANSLVLLLAGRAVTGVGASCLSLSRLYVAWHTPAAKRTALLGMSNGIALLALLVGPALNIGLVHMDFKLFSGELEVNHLTAAGYVMVLVNLIILLGVALWFKEPPSRSDIYDELAGSKAVADEEVDYTAANDDEDVSGSDSGDIGGVLRETVIASTSFDGGDLLAAGSAIDNYDHTPHGERNRTQQQRRSSWGSDVHSASFEGDASCRTEPRAPTSPGTNNGGWKEPLLGGHKHQQPAVNGGGVERADDETLALDAEGYVPVCCLWAPESVQTMMVNLTSLPAAGWFCNSTSFMNSFLIAALETAITPITRAQYGWKTMENSFMFAGIAAVGFISVVVSIVLHNKGFANRWLMVGGYASVAVGMAIILGFGASHQLPLLPLMVSTFFLFFGVFQESGPNQAFYSTMISKNLQGKLGSLNNIVQGVGRAAGPLYSGLALSYPKHWLFFSGLLLVILACASGLRRFWPHLMEIDAMAKRAAKQKKEEEEERERRETREGGEAMSPAAGRDSMSDESTPRDNRTPRYSPPTTSERIDV